MRNPTMSTIQHFLKGRYAAPAFAALGILIMLMVILSGQAPKHSDTPAAPLPVSVITAKQQAVVPRITGHGIVRPATRHQAVAEVSGRVTMVHPDLQPGVFIPAGTLLVQLDTTDYQLALEQVKADYISAQSSLRELLEQQTNLAASLPLTTENLRIAKKELSRKTNLLKRAAISQSQVDSERRNVNQGQQEKLNLERDIAILPSTIAMAEARLNSAKAAINLQQRNIERTAFQMPFDGRIAMIDAEENQFVAVGKTLFVANDVEQVEISGQMSLARLRPFIEVASQVLNHPKASPALPGSLLLKQPDAERIQQMIQQLQLHAIVRQPQFPDAQWPARVISLGERINAQSQTIDVLVAVDAPYQELQPGIKPPLLDGMHVSVELRARAVNGVLLPRQALHETGLYQLDSNQQLRNLDLEPALTMDNWLFINPSHIDIDSQIITTDISLPLPGMKLAGQHDTALQQRVDRAAQPNVIVTSNTISESSMTPESSAALESNTVLESNTTLKPSADSASDTNSDTASSNLREAP